LQEKCKPKKVKETSLLILRDRCLTTTKKQPKKAVFGVPSRKAKNVGNITDLVSDSSDIAYFRPTSFFRLAAQSS
jgi:hypothetical protein